MAADPKKCGFDGNQDMYGMGIRLGYYLQWYGVILASWIAKDEANGLRIANSLFVTATFLALVISTIRADPVLDKMPIVETYIILFLSFGNYLVLVPIFIWRLLTGFKPHWDPSRFPRVSPGRVYSVCNTAILITVLVFQLWFWFYKVPQLDGENCTQYGFFFWKFALNDKVFRAINIVPSAFLLGICGWTVGGIAWRICMRGQNWREVKGHRRTYVPIKEVPKSRVYTLQVIDSVAQGLVTTTIIIGVELSIIWNDIQGVHDVSNAGQTIPLFLGFAGIVMVIYVRYWKKDTEAVLAETATGDPGDIDLAPVQGMDFEYPGETSMNAGLLSGQSRPPRQPQPYKPAFKQQAHAPVWGEGHGASQGYYRTG